MHYPTPYARARALLAQAARGAGPYAAAAKRALTALTTAPPARTDKPKSTATPATKAPVRSDEEVTENLSRLDRELAAAIRREGGTVPKRPAAIAADATLERQRYELDARMGLLEPAGAPRMKGTQLVCSALGERSTVSNSKAPPPPRSQIQRELDARMGIVPTGPRVRREGNTLIFSPAERDE